MSLKAFRQRFAALMDNGLLDAASSTLSEWQARQPRAFEPKFCRVQLALVCGRYREAHDAAALLSPAAACPPDLAAEVFACLKTFALHDAMINWGQLYPQRTKMTARDVADVAVDLSAVGAHDLALEWAELAAAKAPRDPICLVNRALILGYVGKFECAKKDLYRVVADGKQVAMAHWILARIERQTAQSNHIAAIQNALMQSASSPRDRAFLGYALFKELDDLGQHEAAFAALEAAASNALVDEPHDLVGLNRLFEALLDAPVPARNFPQPAPKGEQIPIFIVGMHRSGTTLIERMLGANPQVHDIGETERFAAAVRYGANQYCDRVPDVSLFKLDHPIDFDLVGKVFGQAARTQSQGKPFVTEKSPLNFLNLGLISQALPHAKILHVRRNPIDLCFANYRELFGKQVTHTYHIDDLINFYRRYQELMASWHQRLPGFILDIDYEELVVDPESVSRRIFEFCGLQWHPGVTEVERRVNDPVSTLSSVQVRQPITAASIGRWRPYAQWLGRLLDSFPDT